MESVLFISRFFRRLITRIRGCLLHTSPAVCRHCRTSGGVNATLTEAARRGHVECVKACLTAGADVNTEGSAQGELEFKNFPWGVFMFKYFPWCVLLLECFPWVWDLLMFKYFPWCVLMFKYFPWCVLMYKYFPRACGVFMFKYFQWTWVLLILKNFPWCTYVQILPMGSTSVEILPMGTGIILVQ